MKERPKKRSCILSGVKVEVCNLSIQTDNKLSSTLSACFGFNFNFVFLQTTIAQLQCNARARCFLGYLSIPCLSHVVKSFKEHKSFARALKMRDQPPYLFNLSNILNFQVAEGIQREKHTHTHKIPQMIGQVTSSLGIPRRERERERQRGRQTKRRGQGGKREEYKGT